MKFDRQRKALMKQAALDNVDLLCMYINICVERRALVGFGRSKLTYSRILTISRTQPIQAIKRKTTNQAQRLGRHGCRHHRKRRWEQDHDLNVKF